MHIFSDNSSTVCAWRRNCWQLILIFSLVRLHPPLIRALLCEEGEIINFCLQFLKTIFPLFHRRNCSFCFLYEIFSSSISIFGINKARTYFFTDVILVFSRRKKIATWTSDERDRKVLWEMQLYWRKGVLFANVLYWLPSRRRTEKI